MYLFTYLFALIDIDPGRIRICGKQQNIRLSICISTLVCYIRKSVSIKYWKAFESSNFG